MIDELTQQAYPALPPITPNEMSFRPGAIRGILQAGQSQLLTIQFNLPPPPPVVPGRPPPKPTVAFVLTNSKGTITPVSVPSAESAPP